MSTLGTFAKFVPIKGNPVEKVFNNSKRVLRTATPKGGALVKSGENALATTGSKAIKNSANSSALSYSLPDATRARAKVGKSTQKALEAGTDKKKSNLGLILGVGGGAAALGGGATALALRDKNKNKEKEAKMKSNNRTASFADKEVDPFTPKTSAAGKAASVGIRDKEKQRFAESFGKADDAGKAALKKEAGSYLRQRNIENIADSKGGIGNAYGKAGLKDVGKVTAAVAGQPERKLISAGKNSGSKIVQDIAKGAENLGRKGFTAGATGARGVLNKIAGRTLTGKAVRLGAAGAGIAAIGSALKNKKDNNED